MGLWYVMIIKDFFIQYIPLYLDGRTSSNLLWVLFWIEQFYPVLIKPSKVTFRHQKNFNYRACPDWKIPIYLTEAGAYPQLPTWSFSNLYSSLIWSFWVDLRRKIKIWIRGKKVQFITEKGGSWAFLPWKRNFQ